MGKHQNKIQKNKEKDANFWQLRERAKEEEERLRQLRAHRMYLRVLRRKCDKTELQECLEDNVDIKVIDDSDDIVAEAEAEQDQIRATARLQIEVNLSNYLE